MLMRSMTTSLKSLAAAFAMAGLLSFAAAPLLSAYAQAQAQVQAQQTTPAKKASAFLAEAKKKAAAKKSGEKKTAAKKAPKKAAKKV